MGRGREGEKEGWADGWMNRETGGLKKRVGEITEMGQADRQLNKYRRKIKEG